MSCRPSLPGRLLFLAWLGLCLGIPAVGQGRPLYPGQVFRVGEIPVAVAMADFNRDRHLDLVTANNLSGGVSILLGKGDGTFRAARPFDMGDYPVSAAVADVNGDRHLDLVTANQFSDDVSVRLGKGDGTFRVARHFGVGDFPRAMAVADVNEDGRPDLSTANLDNSMSVLLQ